MSNLGASIGWGLVVGGILVAAVAFPWIRSGLLAGSLAFVGADAMLTRDLEMMDMRRATHAAAAGRHACGRSPRQAIAAGLVVSASLNRSLSA